MLVRGGGGGVGGWGGGGGGWGVWGRTGHGSENRAAGPLGNSLTCLCSINNFSG